MSEKQQWVAQWRLKHEKGNWTTMIDGGPFNSRRSAQHHMKSRSDFEQSQGLFDANYRTVRIEDQRA